VDLDKMFVASVLLAGRDGVRLAKDKGVDEECLGGDGLAVWKFTLSYARDYKSVPDFSIVEGKTGIKLEAPPPAPVEFYIDEVLNRRLHNEIGEKLLLVTKHFKAREPQAAYKEYEAGLRDLRKLGVSVSKTESLPALSPEFLDYYDKIKAGERGVLTPWPTVNEATFGFWPEDLILYVARLGVGKTWILTILANYAWSVQGKRVLFATTEMSRIKILQRWVALYFRFPYGDLRKGLLGEFADQRMRAGLKELESVGGFYIVGGDFDFRIESLEQAIEESEPDIIFMDGAYLLKSYGDGRTESASNSFDELKRCAKRNRVPLVASTQFNRDVKGNKTSSAGAEKIALTDAAGWNSDIVFGLIQTEDMKRDRRMIQKQLKFREGSGEEIETYWDFDTMCFDELPKDPHAAFGAVDGDNVLGGGDRTSQWAPVSEEESASDPYGSGLLLGDTDKTNEEVPF